MGASRWRTAVPPSPASTDPARSSSRCRDGPRALTGTETSDAPRRGGRGAAALAAMGALRRRTAFWASLSGHERRSLTAIGTAIVSLHLLGFGALLASKGGALTIGIGFTAYTLGLRHAFDADHISAIDNTTRKLMAEGKRPLSVGFWFSLGHSTVVFTLTL